MKAISLWQPWASLLLHPSEAHRKAYETRSWAFPHWRMGEPLAVHATATLRKEAREIVEWEDALGEPFFANALGEAGWTLETLPLGAVLGIVRVVECRPTWQVSPTTQEATFGDFGLNRWAWRTEVVERFEAPIPAKGMQGIWTWERSALVAAEGGRG